jgi:hypothetical protein
MSDALCKLSGGRGLSIARFLVDWPGWHHQVLAVCTYVPALAGQAKAFVGLLSSCLRQLACTLSAQLWHSAAYVFVVGPELCGQPDLREQQPTGRDDMLVA